MKKLRFILFMMALMHGVGVNTLLLAQSPADTRGAVGADSSGAGSSAGAVDPTGEASTGAGSSAAQGSLDANASVPAMGVTTQPIEDASDGNNGGSNWGLLGLLGLAGLAGLARRKKQDTDVSTR